MVNVPRADSAEQNTIAAALKYARAGYAVLPVWWLNGKVCGCPQGAACKTPGKHPIESAWQHKATLVPAEIRATFARYPKAHVGIMPPRGHSFIDIDPRNGGKETWRKLMGRDTPLTPIQISGGGGWHLVFKGEPSGALGDGIDIKKAGRGFVVAHPSGHVSGNSYEWKTGKAPWEVEPASLPAQLRGEASTSTPNNLAHAALPLETVREALTFIPSDNYDEHWIPFGQALKHDHGRAGYAVWLEWSKKSEKFDEAQCEYKWSGFDRNRATQPKTCASIIVEARKHGFVYTPEFTAFREESRAIGEGAEESNYLPTSYTLEEMLAEAVYISEGAQVALRNDPRLVWSYADFESMTAASKVIMRSEKAKPELAAKVWKEHRNRVTVHTRTFLAGGELFCKSPDDVDALNTWREPPRIDPPSDWVEYARPFIDHIRYLVPDTQDRITFVNWLAHIEQVPGVLPHVHFLMIARRHGIGRNWLSSVLARVWAGVTALDVDLPQLLDGGFNGRLQRKVLAVVNEIHEGGGARTAYRHADRLRGLLTDERRRVNPKFGREHDEFNAVRWLMFSNHEGALPLDRFDRRVYAIQNPDKPKPERYYIKLYGLASDPMFIASIRELLRTRNIAGFNPGRSAPLTAAKQKVIDASRSEPDRYMEELVEDYPADCITTAAIRDFMEEGLSGISAAALPHIADRAGAKSFPKKVWINSDRGQCRVWILRDHEQWLNAEAKAIAAEVMRGEKAWPQ